MNIIDLQDIKTQRVIFENKVIIVFLGPIRHPQTQFGHITNQAIADIEINYEGRLKKNFIILPIHYNLAIDENLGILMIDNCIALNLKEFEEKFA